MRICTKCNNSYEDYGQRCSFCKECKREYDREYHKNRSNIAKQIKKDKQYKRLDELKEFIYKYLVENPCEICFESDPVVLEFDHIDPEDKSNNISDMIRRGCSIKSLLGEISKCRVLCANCHKRHTAKQFGWYKYNQSFA